MCRGVKVVHTFSSFLKKSSLSLSSSPRRRFNPQLSSGQAVVTGVVPSPPRYVPSIFIAHSSRSPRWTSGSPRMLLVLVREFESRRGEILNLFYEKLKNVSCDESA